MKGIILAGGSGTRLYPSTKVVCKQLLPVYDKPMIYYPLSVLMLAGIREILIISTPEDIGRFEALLGNGTDFGISLEYAVQEAPNGLAEAFIIGADFVGNDDVCLVLGDNIFHGHGMPQMLNKAREDVESKGGATVFGYYVNDPQRYGVVDFDNEGNVVDIEEKPNEPKSHYAVTGLYFYDNSVVDIARNIKPSSRGELEITDLNNEYLKKNNLRVELMGRGYAWLDTGTHESLLEASEFISIIQKRESLKVACIEEIAYESGWIDDAKVKLLAQPLMKNEYGSYLMRMLDEPLPER